MLPPVEYPDNVDFHIILNGPYVKVKDFIDLDPNGNRNDDDDEDDESEEESEEGESSDVSN